MAGDAPALQFRSHVAYAQNIADTFFCHPQARESRGPPARWLVTQIPTVTIFGEILRRLRDSGRYR